MGKVLFFPLGYIQNRPFKKGNFLTVNVPETFHTASGSTEDLCKTINDFQWMNAGDGAQYLPGGEVERITT